MLTVRILPAGGSILTGSLRDWFSMSPNDPEIETSRRRTRFYLVSSALFLLLAAGSWLLAQGMQGNRRIAVEYFLVVFVSIGIAVLAIGLVFAVLSHKSSRNERS
jgi:hypothetical protein